MGSAKAEGADGTTFSVLCPDVGETMRCFQSPVLTATHIRCTFHVVTLYTNVRINVTKTFHKLSLHVVHSDFFLLYSILMVLTVVSNR